MPRTDDNVTFDNSTRILFALQAAADRAIAANAPVGAQGALVAIDNLTGEIKAMVGGRDFNESKFNRATQALRQVGSSFKPYVYTAAIDQGSTPDDTVLDAPVTFQTVSGPYTPHNYDEKFEGTITLRRALAQSRTVRPSVCLLDIVTRLLGVESVTARRKGIVVTELPYGVGTERVMDQIKKLVLANLGTTASAGGTQRWRNAQSSRRP